MPAKRWGFISAEKCPIALLAYISVRGSIMYDKLWSGVKPAHLCILSLWAAHLLKQDCEVPHAEDKHQSHHKLLHLGYYIGGCTLIILLGTNRPLEMSELSNMWKLWTLLKSSLIPNYAHILFAHALYLSGKDLTIMWRSTFCVKTVSGTILIKWVLTGFELLC